MKIKAIYKKKEMNPKEFRNFIRKTITEQAKSQQLNERYDDDENLGIYSGDFDPNEFGGEAMRAAMQDIGSEFEPLGKSRFEKNLNPDEFVADLKRQNLNLPNDKKELGDIEKTMAKKKAHEKMFGAGTLNETGEWSDDEEGNAWIEALRGELELVQNMLSPGLYFIIKDIKGFDKYQGPYAIIEINGDTYKVWTQENDELWIEDFPVDNTSHESAGKGFLGNAAAVADAINHYYSVLATMNENLDDDGKFSESDLDSFQFDMKNLYSYFKDALYSLKDYDSAVAAQILEAAFKRDLPYLSKHLSEGVEFPELMKQFKGNMDRETSQKVSHETPEEKQARISTKLAQHKAKELERRQTDDIIKEEGEEGPSQSRYMFFGNLEQIQRQAGLMLNMDEEKIASILENGHDWAQDHIATAKESMDQVFDFLTNETSENQEEEIEESMIRSHANGRGQNLKPNNFPEEFEREAIIDTLNENLDNAIDTDNDVFQVVDNDFNRAHYKDLIGKTFKDAPGYANVVVIEKPKAGEIPAGSVESDFHNAHQEPVEEEYDYAREERNFHDQENFKDLQQYAGKNLKIKNIDDMYNLVFPDKKRVQSVLNSLKDEINSMHIINSIVAASDYMDTDWLFDITGVDNENVYLDFTGTAK